MGGRGGIFEPLANLRADAFIYQVTFLGRVTDPYLSFGLCFTQPQGSWGGPTPAQVSCYHAERWSVLSLVLVIQET